MCKQLPLQFNYWQNIAFCRTCWCPSPCRDQMLDGRPFKSSVELGERLRAPPQGRFSRVLNISQGRHLFHSYLEHWKRRMFLLKKRRDRGKITNKQLLDGRQFKFIQCNNSLLYSFPFLPKTVPSTYPFCYYFWWYDCKRDVDRKRLSNDHILE